MGKLEKKIITSFFVLMLLWMFVKPSSVYALSLTIHVPEKYANVSAGERFYFELDVKYPENPGRKDLRLTYQILEGEIVISESKVLKAVEAQASFIDFIVIPDNVKSGIHTIKVNISDYDKLSEEVTATFHVVEKPGDQIKLYFLLLLGAVGVVGVLVVINIILSQRRKV
jgi:hypothetical protein